MISQNQVQKPQKRSNHYGTLATQLVLTDPVLVILELEFANLQKDLVPSSHRLCWEQYVDVMSVSLDRTRSETPTFVL